MNTDNSVSSDQSRTIQTRLVLPPDTNHMGTIFGGVILSYIDEIAAITAMKHSRNVVVTASIDQVTFLSPAKVGDILTLEAIVASTGRTSMEIFVKVENENYETGEKTTTTTSFLTMVAKGKDGRPTPVPGVIPVTDAEKMLFNSASERKKKRLEKK